MSEREPTWRLHSLQMTNWGTFHGSGHVLEFSPSTTLISGAPGSGKSTLLDAYLAVMMPGSRLRFNEASNETTGRNRDATTGQRTLLSYLRGKTGEFRERGSAEKRDKLLRGNGVPTWGAIAANFINDAGGQFAAIRLYFVGTAADTDSDITKIGLTADTHIDTDMFDKIKTNKGFRREDLETHFPVKYHTRSTEFDARVQLRLGIGAGGEGAEALILLSRIQSGKAMESVDTMFKELVLDEPETFERADNVAAAFTDTESAYRTAVEAGAKRDALSRIVELHTQISECTAQVGTFEAIERQTETGASVLRTWLRRKELQHLESAVDANIVARDQLEPDHKRTERAANEKLEHFERLTKLLAAEGRDLEALEGERTLADKRLDDITTNKAAFDQDTEVLNLTLATPEDLTAAQAAAAQFLNSHADEKQRLSALRKTATIDAGKADALARHLTEEREQAEKAPGRMPVRLLRARNTIIEHTGLSVEELPFVGELLDIKDTHRQWRVAAEVTLAGLARIMLVDETRLSEFSVSIDSLTMHRINFEGVPLGATRTATPLAGHISEVLQFADDSPFIGWIYDRICGSSDDAQRVDSPDRLGGTTLKVTQAGQTRRGKRGAAGTADVDPVIGFSNEARLAELDEQILAARQERDASDARAREFDKQITHLDTVAAAQVTVTRAHWDRIDKDGAAQAVEKLDRAIRDVVENNPVLQKLRTDKDAAEEAYKEAAKRAAEVRLRIEDLSDQFDALVRRETALVGQQTLDVTVSDDQAAVLGELHTEVTAVDVPDYSEKGFGSTAAAVGRKLRDERARAGERAAAAQDAIELIFASYNKQWPDDPNRGVHYDSYQQYADILEQITADEVYLLREKWRQSMDDQAVNHLIQLKNAYDDAHARIEERLAPIRRILATLPFGERRRRISIERDLRVLDEVVALRASIDALTTELAKQRTDEEYEVRYHQMREIIDQIRRPEPGAGGAARRRRLLNVNEHIYITAIEYDPGDPDHVEIKRYDQLAPLSGGERQEFVAFMSAAALRYRLGDTHHERPRFAPVVLDEAFIKANGDFARRGVDAWTELGFQLVIAAPQDKVTGVETLMAERKCITKNPENRSYISDYRLDNEDA
ncbi:ATP-binding protein [Mycolicibacterium sp. 120266]|uniref:ATP-binding protein n=1 Tax=Mycolicibacterium sp. 120266 TaxID=3090601 RepID=UPI00299ED992|nr:ATP-binding protein [Mycolicibacterium sp. 120266]MDX1873278.1 ATP-binding protein [Mycolicibacterium sp. 120266]